MVGDATSWLGDAGGRKVQKESGIEMFSECVSHLLTASGTASKVGMKTHKRDQMGASMQPGTFSRIGGCVYHGAVFQSKVFRIILKWHVYRFDCKPKGKTLFAKSFQVKHQKI